MDEIQRLKIEIEEIKKRNIKVEADKAWETSKTRLFTITLITYVLATILLYTIGNSKPFINALVPTLGYFLSFQSLPFIKRWWMKNIKK